MASREEIEAEERALTYSGAFGAAEALELGCAVAALAPEYERGVSVAIYRESDGMVMFMWAMDDKAPRNVRFLEAKCDAVRASGHASLWTDPADPATGGGFPVRSASGGLTAVLAISGLHHGEDHELAVRALRSALK